MERVAYEILVRAALKTNIDQYFLHKGMYLISLYTDRNFMFNKIIKE